MENLEVFVGLLITVALLSVISEKIKVAYPIVLLVVGVIISVTPFLPDVQLEPDLVLLLFLPPILYSAAWGTSWPEFRSSLRSISLLAFGCTIFTTIGVAWFASSFIPGFSWETGFLLGAIISPPDAVAAVAITRGLGLPRRVKTILEGESLVNDAMALIAFRFGIAAVITGAMNMADFTTQFFIVGLGGLVIGLIIAFIIYQMHRFIHNSPVVDVSFTLLTPYLSYLTAEKFHLSGVLAVVTTGLFLSRKSSELFSHQTRLQSISVWTTLIFLMEGIIFILMGMQINDVLYEVFKYDPMQLLTWGLLLTGVIMALRLIWIYPGAYIPRWVSKKIRETEPETNVRAVTIVGWTGIRGVVSLAAALALPLSLPNGDVFPQRELILFLTFSVIVFTMLIQGLSLPSLIKFFKMNRPAEADRSELEVRRLLAIESIEYIEENFSMGELTDDVLNQLKSKYEINLQRVQKAMQQFNAGLKPLDDLPEAKALEEQFQHAQRDMLAFERKRLLALRKIGRISDEVFRRIEYELDLEEARLALESGSSPTGH